MTRTTAIAMAALILLLAVACRQSTSEESGRSGVDDGAPDVTLRLEPDPDSLSVGPLRFHVTLLDSDGAPIDRAAPVLVRGDMAHAGMQPVLATAVARGEGVYSADFEWTMAGDWIVTVEATLPDGRVKVAAFPFTVESK